MTLTMTKPMTAVEAFTALDKLFSKRSTWTAGQMWDRKGKNNTECFCLVGGLQRVLLGEEYKGGNPEQFTTVDGKPLGTHPAFHVLADALGPAVENGDDTRYYAIIAWNDKRYRRVREVRQAVKDAKELAEARGL